jgi:hypothetical protein
MCDMMSAPNTLGIDDAPGPDDIVIHFRSEGTGATGFGGFPFLNRAVEDARKLHGGKQVVVVVMKPCLAGHPSVIYMVNNFGARVRAPNYIPGANAALKDLHYLAMARLLVLSVSTFSYWAAYTSESAEAIWFPIPDKMATFNPWCEGIAGFAATSRPMTIFLDSRTGEPQPTAEDAIRLCFAHSREAANTPEIFAAYGLDRNGNTAGKLAPDGCWGNGLVN